MSLMRCHGCDRNIDIDYEEMFNESKCMKCFLRDNPEEKHCSNMVKDNQGRDCLPCGDVVGEMGDYVKAICKECIEKEKSDLDRAKELREEFISVSEHFKIQYKKYGKKNYEKSYVLLSIREEAKQLKEKVEKGCENCKKNAGALNDIIYQCPKCKKGINNFYIVDAFENPCLNVHSSERRFLEILMTTQKYHKNHHGVYMKIVKEGTECRIIYCEDCQETLKILTEILE